MEDNFSTEWGGGVIVQAVMQSDGEPWGAADEASLACLPLISCCVARSLRDHGLVPVHCLGAGDPCIREFVRGT